MSAKFEIDTAAVKSEILQAEWMKTYIQSEAQSMAGADEHIKSFVGFDRAKAIIYPDTKENN